MPRSMNRWALATRIVVTGVPMIALAYMVMKEDAHDQAVFGWVYLVLAMIVWLVGALVGRIVVG